MRAKIEAVLDAVGGRISRDGSSPLVVAVGSRLRYRLLGQGGTQHYPLRLTIDLQPAGRGVQLQVIGEDDEGWYFKHLADGRQVFLDRFDELGRLLKTQVGVL